MSGGQTSDQAIFNLNEIVKLNHTKTFGKWDLSFSFGRALQDEALAIWNGKDENIQIAKEKLLEVLKKTSSARMGEL